MLDETLFVDEIDCDRLAKRLIVCSMGGTNELKVNKGVLLLFTKTILKSVCPGKTFD